VKNVYQKLADSITIGAIKATVYLSETHTIKATIHHKYHRQRVITFTDGRPNYAERKFIKACKQAGEKFPIKKIQVKF
jgi:hypothetical protein